MSALRKNGRAGQPQRPSAIRSPRRIRNAPAEIRRSGPSPLRPGLAARPRRNPAQRPVPAEARRWPFV